MVLFDFLNTLGLEISVADAEILFPDNYYGSEGMVYPSLTDISPKPNFYQRV